LKVFKHTKILAIFKTRNGWFGQNTNLLAVIPF